MFFLFPAAATSGAAQLSTEGVPEFGSTLVEREFTRRTRGIARLPPSVWVGNDFIAGMSVRPDDRDSILRNSLRRGASRISAVDAVG